ncbi:MAM and LDL-receptor class A domain-containing protein 1-like [Panulirus ornatus]|uniref:MAM and LDL-receptor class A domain-containing protein 1-like n=1 Tax=Panulirus ornatus TaxID=150431 RepID=UPI003A8BF006
MKCLVLMFTASALMGTCLAWPQQQLLRKRAVAQAPATAGEAANDSVVAVAQAINVHVRTKRQETEENPGDQSNPEDEPQPQEDPVQPRQEPPPELPTPPPEPQPGPQPEIPPPQPQQPPPPPPPPPQPQPPPPQPPPQQPRPQRPPPRRPTRPSGDGSGPQHPGGGKDQSGADLCDFGTSPDVGLCDWTNLKVTELKWQPSKGESAFWLGGPEDDATYGDGQGGYAVFETSQIPVRVTGRPTFKSAMLMSDIRESTGPTGMCVKFWYAISGLSPDRLRVLLHPMADNTSQGDPVDEVMKGYDGSEDVVLWEARDLTMGDWKEGQVVYTFDRKHSVIFEGIPLDSSDPNRPFRGYIAVDELSFTDSSQCSAFCTFEGGTCGWTQDSNDDFDWTLVRVRSGPGVGGCLLTDSSPSPAYMAGFRNYLGSDIVETRFMEVKVRCKENGKAVQKFDSRGTRIKVGIVFEGVVGNNNLGDIAIDDISIVQGACPSAPQVAAGKSGDCTFEVDECEWVNPGPRDRLDEMDWMRTLASESRSPSRDHTIGSDQGSAASDATAQVLGFYVTLPRGSIQRGGDRAWLMSAVMKGSSDAMCLAFWYFMYEPFIDPAGPSLGSLTVYMRYENSEGDLVLQPVWSLKNHQGPNWMYGQANLKNENDFVVLFEGVWGSSRGSGYIALDDITLFTGDCSTMPQKATTLSGDCDFQRNACQWKNTTTDSDFRWTTASISRRPANLPDHTFGGPIGYAYFDVFNQNARPQSLTLLSSPMDKAEDNNPICFTFWYAYFGASESTKLKLIREAYDKTADEDQKAGNPVELWVLEAANSGTQRPEWHYAQVAVDASSDYRVSIMGMATNGGFAIDDIKTYSGSCGTRPENANPSVTEEAPSTK